MNIPATGSPISMDTSTAGASSPVATPIEDAAAGLGEAISKVSGNIMRDVLESEGKTAVAKQMFNDSSKSYDYQAQLLQKYPTGYITDEKGNNVQNPSDGSFRTILHEYKDFSEKLYADGKAAMPNPYALESYSSEARKKFYDYHDAFRAKELSLRASTFDINTNAVVEQLRQRLVNNPDPKQAIDQMRFLAAGVNAQAAPLRMTPAELQARLGKLYDGVTDGLMEGYRSAATNPPKKGPGSADRVAYIDRALYDLKHRKGIADIMPSEKRAHWIDYFQNMRNQSSSMDSTDWFRQMEDATRSAKGPDGVSNDAKTALLSRMPGLAAGGVPLDKLHRAALGLLVVDAARPGLYDPMAGFLPKEQRDAYFEKLANRAVDSYTAGLSGKDKEFMSLHASESKAWVREKAKELSNSAEDEIKQDWVGFAEGRDRTLRAKSAIQNFSDPANFKDPQKAQAFLDNMNQLDEYSKIRSGGSLNHVYLNKGQVEQIATLLDGRDLASGRTAADVVQLLDSIHSIDPSRYSHIVQQVVDQKNLDPAWHFAIKMNDPEYAPLRAAFVEALTNRGKVVDVEAKLPSMTNPSDVKRKILTEAGPYYSNLLSKSGTQATPSEERAMTEAIYTVAMNKIGRGEYTPAQWRDAASAAVKMFVGDRGHVVETYSNAVYLPKRLHGTQISQDMATNVSRNLNLYLKNMATVMPDMPRGFLADSGGTHEQRKQKWSDFLETKENFFFEFDERRGVIYPKVRTPDSPYNQYLYKNGRPIEMHVLDGKDGSKGITSHDPDAATAWDKAKAAASKAVNAAIGGVEAGYKAAVKAGFGVVDGASGAGAKPSPTPKPTRSRAGDKF